MNIYGIGIDIVDTHRIEDSLNEFGDRFINRIFTRREHTYCAKMRYPGPHYAVRFAAKEAIAKSFGVGIGEHLNWTDMEILRDELGKPYVVLFGEGKKFAEEKGITEVMVSLSHSDNHAAANAVAICSG
ncbi:MAG: holo-ACP synthase [Verrucomicrobiales bacterium]|nr:holo-ACP synthase [Verrucomicrobiales bacterium]